MAATLSVGDGDPALDERLSNEPVLPRDLSVEGEAAGHLLTVR